MRRANAREGNQWRIGKAQDRGAKIAETITFRLWKLNKMCPSGKFIIRRGRVKLTRPRGAESQVPTCSGSGECFRFLR